MKYLYSIAALAVVLSLGGCLSGESSDESFGSSETPNASQNSAPQIWGSPDSAIKTGDVYEFIPTASDADGDPITFSITNKPGWATFNTASGRLSGQPLLGDIGVYSAISITASDGTETTGLGPFSIEVTETALGAMTLSWTPPTQNEDGSTLTDLAGYKIYYGTSSGRYTNQVHIDTPGIATYVIDNLLPDRYYIVATAINSSGMESRYSSEAVKDVTSM